MSSKQQQLAGIAALVLVGIYSWIMVATSGSANYAWIILVTAVALLVATGRSVAAGQEKRQNG